MESAVEFQPGDTRSSVFGRLSAEERRELNHAIVECRDGGLKGTYRALKLEDRGVSLRAFYRYARRVRARAALLDAAELTRDCNAGGRANLALLAQQELLFELTLGDPTPRALERLARICYVTARAQLLINEIMMNGSGQLLPPAPAEDNSTPAIQSAIAT
jgi:hypothetical protein